MKFMKLKTKYILSYALTILCPILLFLGIILNVVSNVIVKQSIENEVQINKQFKNNVGYIFKDYASIVNRLCYSGELQNLVGLDAETLQKNLSSFLNQKEIIRSSILFYNYQGALTVYLREDSPLIDYLFFMKLEDGGPQNALYQQLSQEENRIDWRFENGKVTVSRPITSYTSESFGLVQLVVREQDIYQLFSSYRPEDRYIVIVDETGKVISSNDRAIVGTDYSGQDVYQRRLDGDMLYTQDGSCAVLYEQLEQMDDGPSWTIITQIPVKNMRQLANTVLQIGCLTAGLCFLASSLLYLLLSGDVVRRVQKLSLYMDLQRESKFVPIPIQGPKDELYKVQLAFNRMIASLEQLIHDNYLSQLKIKNVLIEKQSAELIALQNQIHPHFLFNTLESIRMKLQNGDSQHAQDMLVSLSRILRLSLSDREDLIPLKSELEYVGHYIKIQNLRFPKRYTFEISFEEEMLEYCVPKYAIQTLVENAVLHGIDPKGGEGRISVKGEKEGEDLCIRVTDNGVGIPEGKLKKIRDRLASARETSDEEGIGIQNVNDRLTMHFGEAYAVQLNSMEEQGTEVVVRVPCHHC